MANDCSTWLFWHHPVDVSDRRLIVGSGTVFFLDAGGGPFGVTASHVIRALREAKEHHQQLAVQMGCIAYDPTNLVLGDDPARDLATFRIDQRVLAALGKTRHIDPRQWPPPRPQLGRGVFFGGYRGPENKLISLNEPLPWDFWHGFGAVTGVFDDQLSMRFERAEWVRRPGRQEPPLGADWGGTSGGPMFALFETEIVYFRLGGVIKEYSAEVELMVFAPIERIRTDGTLVG
jgi:hypothetical protein